MKNKKSAKKKDNVLITLAAVTGTAIVAVEGYNYLNFQITAGKKEYVSEENLHKWKKGYFYYEKINNKSTEELNEKKDNTPILILHEIDPCEDARSNQELAIELSKKKEVYLMDYLGCGRSEKKPITYSAYLYILQISEMIEKIIRKPVHLVAKGNSAAIAIAAASNYPENISKITLIDPPEYDGANNTNLDKKTKWMGKMIEMPVAGPLIYHTKFKKNRNAHIGGENARFLYASIVRKYTDWDVSRMVENMNTQISIVKTSIDEEE